MPKSTSTLRSTPGNPGNPATAVIGQSGGPTVVINQSLCFKHLFKMMQIGGPIDFPLILAIGGDIRCFVLVGKLAGDRLEHINGRHQTLYGPELIGNQDQLTA